MLVNDGILNRFRLSPLLNAPLAITDKTIYVSAGNYNGLYAVDIASGKLKFIGKFSNEGNFDTFLFHVKRHGKRLIFAPISADELAFYDLEKNQIKETAMKSVISMNLNAISTFTVVDDILYLFPAKANAIILYSMSDESILEVINIADTYKSVFGENYVALSATDSNYIYENKIYIPCWIHPAFMSLDLDSRTVEFYKITGYHEGFCSLCGMGNVIYALNRNGVLVKWDIVSRKVLDESGILADRSSAEEYRRLVVVGEYLYLFSDWGGVLKIIKTDLDMQLEREGLPQEIVDGLGKKCSDETVYVGCLYEEKLYCYTDKNHYLCIDMKSEKMEWVRDVLYDSVELRKIIFDETDVLERNIIQETDIMTITELMNRQMLCDHIAPLKEENTGKIVYQSLKG